jgi:tetratricopeptide (TPR) repeat protein
MKKILVLALTFFPFAWSMNQAQQRSSQEPPRYHDFDRIAITGHVYNEGQVPLPGITVEIRLAYDAQREEPEILGSLEFEHYIWEYLVLSLGTHIFGWAETDEKGYFRLTGVPNPGAYFLLVRHADNFLQTRVPVIIHKTGAKEFEADIFLRVRKSSLLQMSRNAIQEIAAAKDAAAGYDFDQAIMHFKNALEIEPEFAEAHYNLGILLRQRGDTREAVKHFVNAIKYQDDYWLAFFALGETLHIQKKHSQSNLYLMKYLEDSEQETSENIARAHYLLGTNHNDLNHAEKAIFHLSRALELNPEIDPNAYLLLANSYVRIRDGENAIKYYKKLVALYPYAPNLQEVKAVLEKLESMYPEKK